MRLFVYGSLQPGHWNYERVFGDSEVKKIEDVRVPGRVYFAFDSPSSYPVAVYDPFQTEDQIIGTLIEVNVDSPEWSFIYAMEKGAGYELIYFHIEVEGERRLVVMFDWPHEVSENLRIHSGDWAKEVSSNDLHT